MPAVAGLLLLVLLLPRRADGQFPAGSPLADRLAAFAVADLNYSVVTQGDPALVTRHHPDLYLLPRSFYTLAPSTLFTQNVIFDPCRGQPANCCNNTFGTPEFERFDAASGARAHAYADGSPAPASALRRPRDQLLIDPTCTGPQQPRGRPDCVTSRVASAPWPAMPACWNWNASVRAGLGCRSPLDGSPLPLCLELGYTQNAYVADCGGNYQGSGHCGTYLEVHRPGREDKLAEVRLPGVLPSGYLMTVISTTYKRNASLALCFDPVKGGRYELWWVLRALDGFYVQRRLPFAVVSPLCDWDALNNRYSEYATLGLPGQVLAGVDYFNASLRLYTQPALNGSASKPGVGMGSTLVVLPPPDPNAPPPFFNATLGTLQ